MSVQLTWRTIVRRIQNFDHERAIRQLRHHPRRPLAALVVFIFFIFVFTRSSKSSTPEFADKKCTVDNLKHWNDAIQNYDIGLDENSVNFIGNGFIGIDSAGQLRTQKNLNSNVLDVETAFYPALETEIETSSSVEKTTLTDFQNGLLRYLKCFSVDGECACVTSTIYAHRTRPNIIFQSIQIKNPSKSSVRLSLIRKPSNWWAHTKTGDITSHQRKIGNVSYSIVCSDAPGKVTILQKREETFRFVCTVSSKYLEDEQKDVKVEALKLFTKSKEIQNMDSEHIEGWSKLHLSSFHVAHSKAPNTLNGNRINATKYILMSNLRAPTIEIGSSVETVKQLEIEARKSELCYTGHSNLFYPSRLWTEWDEPNKLIDLVNTWMLTFEKRGCSNLLKTGAIGISQAFVQSLTASSYHDSHLEIALDAHDLHREMSFKGIPVYSSMGVVGTIHVEIKLDEENRPYFMVSSSSQLFACDGGCIDKPVILGRVASKLPVKVTKPVTSLLYVATNRRHLEQLKTAIHVAEVGAAPAHEDEMIELHRSGENSGGLPTSFWVLLVIVLIAFHLFLAKVLWSEWRKGDMTPYNPYLRNRYSTMNHYGTKKETYH